MPRTLHARAALAAALAVLLLVPPFLVPSSGVDAGPVHAQHVTRLGKAAALVINAPPSARTGADVRFVGDVVVKARRARTVQLTERRSGRWQVIGRTKSSRTGVFRFRVQAGQTADIRVFRAVAPRVRSQRLPAVKARVVRVRVTQPEVPVAPAPVTPPVVPSIPGTSEYDAAEPLAVGYVANGSASDWSYLFDGPVLVGSRWNPCRVITWTYNQAGEAYPALADVTRAFAKISGVSGLKFKYVGPSTYRYLGSGFAGFPASVSIAVGWANEAEADDLEGDVVGIGGGSATLAMPGSDVAYRMFRGYLTLDNGNDFAIAPGFDSVGWGQIMMHEVLHALGLGHATEPVQLMAGTATPQNVRFGAGDITGMNKIGAPSGCLS